MGSRMVINPNTGSLVLPSEERFERLRAKGLVYQSSEGVYRFIAVGGNDV